MRQASSTRIATAMPLNSSRYHKACIRSRATRTFPSSKTRIRLRDFSGFEKLGQPLCLRISLCFNCVPSIYRPNPGNRGRLLGCIPRQVPPFGGSPRKASLHKPAFFTPAGRRTDLSGIPNRSMGQRYVRFWEHLLRKLFKISIKKCSAGQKSCL